MAERISQSGYIGVMTVLIVAGITLALAVAAGLLGINQAAEGLALQQSLVAAQMADGCIEEAVYRLKRDTSYTGGTIPYDSGTCSLSVGGSGSTRTITSSAAYEDYTQTIVAEVSLETNTAGNAKGIDLTSWTEQ